MVVNVVVLVDVVHHHAPRASRWDGGGRGRDGGDCRMIGMLKVGLVGPGPVVESCRDESESASCLSSARYSITAACRRLIESWGQYRRGSSEQPRVMPALRIAEMFPAWTLPRSTSVNTLRRLASRSKARVRKDAI